MSEQKASEAATGKSLILPIGVGVLSIAAILGGVGVFAAAQASGAQSTKVVICHRTSAQNNPYVAQEIDTDSIDNPNDDVTPTETPSVTDSALPSSSPSESSPSDDKTKKPKSAAQSNSNYLNGHGDHTGPLFVEGAVEWGDIIPPFTSAKGNSFPGYNWLNGGQAIWELNCNVGTPSPTDTATTSATPTVNPSSSTGAPTSPAPSTPPASTPGGGGGGGGTAETPAVVTPTASAPGAATVAPGTVVLPTEMPNPINVAPGAVQLAPGTVSSVPAGNGELVLSLAGMTLVGGGIAGVAGTSVWIADRRRRRTA